MKKVVFRVDTSRIIGMGHLMRCFTLAEALKTSGAEAHFISRDWPEFPRSLLSQKGFTLHALPVERSAAIHHAEPACAHAAWLGADPEADAEACLEILQTLGQADLLVIDHYAIDARWERKARGQAEKILVIDDLADRAHACDFLLDQNHYEDAAGRYAPWVDEKTECLFGPHYALLRPEFHASREAISKTKSVQEQVARVTICFGGGDAAGETLKALEALKPWLEKGELEADVILGATAPQREIVEGWMRSYAGLFLHLSPLNLAELLAKADLGIGAAGSMIWERACVGLPSIAVAVAHNQQTVGREAGAAGLHLFAGSNKELSVERLREQIAFLMKHPLLRQCYRDTGLKQVDGLGAGRVARRVWTPELFLRRVELRDCEQIWSWRNAAVNRRFAHDGRDIPYADHQEWFEKIVRDKDRILLIGADSKGDAGVLRYDRQGEYWLTSIYLVPGRHGEGLGAPLLHQGAKWLKKHVPGRIRLRAEIQGENVASRIVFEQAGYKKQFSTFIAEASAE